LRKFIDADSSLSIDVNLVLSANTKYDDLRDIYNNFSILDIDTIMVTKFDETKSFGNIFSFIYDISKPVSYFSVGQEVPDDLYVANSKYLVECVFDGFETATKNRNGKTSGSSKKS
jgi:flagellar biosynthesis protein FlhF